MTLIDQASLLESAQRALLGAVSPRLYAACVRASGPEIVISWFVAPDLSEDEHEDLCIAGTEIVANFPSPAEIKELFITVQDPRSPLLSNGTWIYLQRGFKVK